MVCVRKRDGTLRLCIDCCKVDNKTVKQAEPIPKTQDTLNHLAGSQWFTVLYQGMAYHQGNVSVCLFGVYVPFENFSLIWKRHHSRSRLQILTYARKSWPLSSESYLTCHTCCDTGLSFIMVISEDPWHSHLLPNVCQWSCHYRFLRLRSCLSQANLWTLLRRHGPFTSGIAYHSASLELLAHPKIHEWNSTGLLWPVLYSLPWWNYY